MTNKRISTLITLLLFLLLLVGCKAINQAPIITSIPITAVELGETYTYDVNATDPEGDTLTYSLITKPTGMTITSATGLIKWTSKAEGNYAVVVKVSDGVLYIIQSFTIVASKLPDPPAPPPIVNYAPIITSIPGDTAIIGMAYTYDVNATDPEGDVLTYSLTKKPDDMTINSTTGLISWTPAPDQIGNNPVIVKVSDGKKATTQSFTITVKAVEPDPEIELTGIVVDPKKMTLFAGGSESIKSVTAIYEIRGFGVPVLPGDCTFLSTDEDIAIAEESHFKEVNVKAVGVGTATIIVNYGGKADTMSVTVIDLVHNINQETYYHTIQEAIDDESTSAGDTIEVAAGTYSEAVLIDKQLILNGANASKSIIDGGETTAITISADDVTVDGFTLDGGITLDDSSNTISGGTISNNIITGADNPDEPIKAENGILLGWDYGKGVDWITIENNIIKNNRCKGIRFACPIKYISWGGTTPGNSHITVCNNEIKDNKAGMDTYGPGPNTIIDNIISDNVNAGMNLRFDDGDVVTGNIITNNTGPGITLCQVTNTVVENNSVSGHQSIDIAGGSGIAGSKGSGIQILKASEDNTIRFNDIYDNNYGVFIRSKQGLQPSGNSINRNNIHGNKTYGILNALIDPLVPVDATNNWWGIGSTDENAGKPGEGGNNNVSVNVDYEPWSNSEF
ncbi:hypothetical protein ES705_27634 [subsurface metagenome]